MYGFLQAGEFSRQINQPIIDKVNNGIALSPNQKWVAVRSVGTKFYTMDLELEFDTLEEFVAAREAARPQIMQWMREHRDLVGRRVY